MSAPAAVASVSCNLKALSTLMAVSLTGKVRDSVYPNVNAGDEVKVSFIAERESLVRFIEGQGLVTDGIAPYKVCPEDFTLSFNKKEHMHLAPLPPTLTGEPSNVWFSVMSKRVVYDGAWVSIDPIDGSKGVPLLIHGEDVDATGAPTTKVGAVFDVSLARGTFASTEASALVGHSYDATELNAEGTTMQLWKGWEQNVQITVDFEKLSIKKVGGN